MSLSRTTLTAIQHAGTAVYAADAELKNAARAYAERVNAAMGANPFGLGNDALFDHWKLVARLSQTVAGIEEELKKVYQLAAELTADDGPAVHNMPALAAPRPGPDQRVTAQPDTAPTDVRVKRRNKKSAPRAAKARPAPGSNPARLLRHLERVLNSSDFTAINRSASGLATGIPMGSINAAVKKLIETGQIIAGPAGSLKLTR